MNPRALATALAIAILTILPSCLLMTDKDGNRVIDYETTAELLEANAIDFRDLGYEDVATTLETLAAGIRTIKDTGEGKLSEKLDAAITFLEPLKASSDPDVAEIAMLLTITLRNTSVFVKQAERANEPPEPTLELATD